MLRTSVREAGGGDAGGGDAEDVSPPASSSCPASVHQSPRTATSGGRSRGEPTGRRLIPPTQTSLPPHLSSPPLPLAASGAASGVPGLPPLAQQPQARLLLLLLL